MISATVRYSSYFKTSAFVYELIIITDRINAAGNAFASVPLSVCLSISFHSVFGTDIPLTLNCTRVGHDHSCRQLKVKVRVLGLANAFGLTSIKGSFLVTIILL